MANRTRCSQRIYKTLYNDTCSDPSCHIHYGRNATEVRRAKTYMKSRRLDKQMGGDYRGRLLLSDNEALWSFTNFKIGQDICNQLLKLPGVNRQSLITDAFAGIGGNTIIFCRNFANVRAVELNSGRAKMLTHNLNIFQIKNSTVLTGYYQVVNNRCIQDVVYFDPPWGLSYRKEDVVRITVDDPRGSTSIERMIADARLTTEYCVVKLPVNYDEKYFREQIEDKLVGTIIKVIKYGRPNSMLIVYIKFNQ